MPGTTNKVDDPCEECRSQSPPLHSSACFLSSCIDILSPQIVISNVRPIKTVSHARRVCPPRPFGNLSQTRTQELEGDSRPHARELRDVFTATAYFTRRTWLIQAKATTKDRNVLSVRGPARSVAAQRVNEDSETGRVRSMRSSFQKIKSG